MCTLHVRTREITKDCCTSTDPSVVSNRGFCRLVVDRVMISWHIVLFFRCLIAVPTFLSHQLQNYPYDRALEISKLNRNRSVNPNIVFLERARVAAIRYHDAAKDGSAVIKAIMDSTYKNKNTHTTHLIRNPTVDLSAYNNYLAKKVLDRNDIDSMKLLVNNSRVDLSFDDNYLLKEAEKRKKHQMTEILKYDSNIRNQITSGQELEIASKDIDAPSLAKNSDLDVVNEETVLPSRPELDVSKEESDGLAQPNDYQDLFSKSANTILSSVYPDEQVSVNINDLSLDDDYTSISESSDDQKSGSRRAGRKNFGHLKKKKFPKDELGWIEIDIPLEDDWITVGNPDNVSLLSK